MDDPALPEAEHRRALRGLRRINAWSGTAKVLLRPLLQWSAARGVRTLRVLDVGCGGGDVAAALTAAARRAGLTLQWTLLDCSPVALTAARAAVGGDAETARLDIVKDGWPGGFDAATCTLVLHHLDEADAAAVLAKMAGAAEVVLADDLVRSRLGLALAWLGTRVLSRSPVVHVDGPLSVRGAFTAEELGQLAERAGLSGATVTRHWPCRALVEWRRG